MTPQTVVVIAVVPLVAWRLYSRMRRLVGRQRSRPSRHWTAVVLFPLLVLMLALAAAANATALAALAGGVAVGCGLGVAGLRLTRFERTPDGWFYTPNAHIGIVLSVLLVARIAWRLLEVALHGAAPASAQWGSSPLTLVVFGMLAAYYSVYAAGILRWRRSAK
ncbi:MAG TPA: hypothetical protein VLY46_04175 [Usitatibacter sp.]|nr:hypothetical protein [Usitatibacter sp.]